jgi:hypothetical protein
MRRLPGPVRTFLLVLVAGLVLLLVLALADRRGFSLDVPSDSQVLVRPGEERCSGIIRPPGAGADRVRFWARASEPGPLPPIVVFVRRSRTAQTLADGTAAPGPPGARSVHLRGSVAGSRKVTACFLNAGARPAILTPRPGTATRVTVERSDGLADYADIGLELGRSDDRSLLALLPDVFERASLFRPGWVGAWTYWLLLVALVIGVPLLLSRALASASEEDGDDTSPASESSRAST